jgi:hypothetical protein
MTSLTTPTNVFASDNLLSNKLNDFQSRYARFVRCEDGSGEQCTKDDTFVNVQRSYQSLLTTINDLEHSLDTQVQDGVTPEENADDHEDILQTYAALRAQRQQMDLLMARLYSENKAGPGSSQEQLKQAMFANTLWIILASCLIWYAIVEM